MPITNIISKVKKIDIQNKVIGDDWKQTITLTLGEIELKNENLIALRQFRPFEEVLVNLKSLQLSLGDLPEDQKILFLEKDTDATPVPEPVRGSKESDAEEVEIDLSAPVILERVPIEVKEFEEGEEDDVDPKDIVKSYTF